MGTSSLAYLTAEVCASSALLHCGLVWYGLALCSMVQFGLVCELCTSCAAHQRPRQCGHNLFASPPHPSYPCLWNTRVCRIWLHPSCLLFLHSEAGGFNKFLVDKAYSVDQCECKSLLEIAMPCCQHHSTRTNFSFLQPKSREVDSGTSQPWIGAYAVEKHQLGGSHSGKVSRRRKSGQATLEVGHVTIWGVADHQLRCNGPPTRSSALRHKSHGLRADPGKLLAHKPRRRDPTQTTLVIFCL